MDPRPPATPHTLTLRDTRLTVLRSVRAIVTMGATVAQTEPSHTRATAVAAAVLRRGAAGTHETNAPAVVIAIARFLYGGLRGRVRNAFCVLPAGRNREKYKDDHGPVSSMALAHDGATLFATLEYFKGVQVFRVADGAPLRVLCPKARSYQVYVAADGFIFVAATSDDCIHVFTPSMEPHQRIQQDEAHPLGPVGVCADDTRVYASSHGRIHVFRRADGAPLTVMDMRLGHMSASFGLDGYSELRLVRDAMGADAIMFNAVDRVFVRPRVVERQTFLATVCVETGTIGAIYGRGGSLFLKPSVPVSFDVAANGEIVISDPPNQLVFVDMNTQATRTVQVRTTEDVYLEGVATCGRIVVAYEHRSGCCFVIV